MASHKKTAPATTGGQESQPQPKHRKLSRKQRFIAWTASLSGIAVGAFVTAFAGNFGDHAATLVSSIGSHPTPASASAGKPVTIDYVGLEQPQDGTEVVAFPRPVMLSARQLGQLNAIPDYASENAWLTARGAVQAGLNILVIVQGNRAHTVRIVDIQPVPSCTQPLHGALFYAPSAGADPTTQLNLNLDTPRAPLSYTESYEVNGVWIVKTFSDYFGHYTISLDPGEQFTFAIAAATQLHYCRFTLDMTVVDGTQTVVEPITDHGKPFQVTALYATDGSPDFSRYSAVYLGGVAAIGRKTSGSGWSRVNPAAAATSP
jgi:hypothetical protein